jgi:hypothetical protein
MSGSKKGRSAFDDITNVENNPQSLAAQQQKVSPEPAQPSAMPTLRAERHRELPPLPLTSAGKEMAALYAWPISYFNIPYFYTFAVTLPHVAEGCLSKPQLYISDP